MANYVSNKIICKKMFYEEYFLDERPFGDEFPVDKPRLSFNKLFGVKDTSEYYDKYGAYVCYSFGYNVKEIDNGLVEIKFRTKGVYPICGIIRAIELDHDIVWYATEENHIYLSKFCWNDNKVIEETLNLETKEYEEWCDNSGYYSYDNEKELDDYDDVIWHYDFEKSKNWKYWPSDNLVERCNNWFAFLDYREWINENTK